jgi:XRE family transcriptional regulator, master regulator for biofilm formation
VIRKLREAKGMTQRDLARKAKVTPGYVAQLETGLRKNPSIFVLRKLAKALGVPVTALLE